MIDDENLIKLYNCVLENQELTTKVLNSYGFSSKDLNNLIEQGKLIRVKRGFYSFVSTDDLFNYGRYLIKNKDYVKGNRCFEVCNDMNPDDMKICFRLFIENIEKDNYDEVFKYFKILCNTDNPYYVADNNVYLYLLSRITEIPVEYRKHVKSLTFNDMCVDCQDKRYKDVSTQSKVRLSIIQNKFSYALQQLHNLTIKHNKATIQETVIKMLLYKAVSQDNKHKETMLELVSNKKYEELVKYLKHKEKCFKLSELENSVLKIIDDMNVIKSSGIIPKIDLNNSEKIYDAIDDKDYKLALKLASEHANKYNLDESKNVICILLKDICSIIDDVKKQEELSRKQDQQNSQVTLFDIVTLLINNDLENAFVAVNKYMKNINKSEYEFLVDDLIKLSVLEKDIAFIKPTVVLTYLTQNKFQFDISSYVQEFYTNLSLKKYEEARIYLDIITKSKNIGEDIMIVDALTQILDNLENIDVTPKKTEFVKEEKGNVEKEDILIEQTQQKVENIPVVQIERRKPIEVRDSSKEFIASKREELINGSGMVLLRPMNKERRAEIHQIVKTYRDVASFSIGDGDDRRIVLRYKPYIPEKINISKIIKDGNDFYAKGQYESALNEYKKLLQFGNPPTMTYAKMGLIYLKIARKDKAIDFLTVATKLSKERKETIDFSDFIYKLQGKISDEDIKPKVIMKEKDFKNDLVDNYGISCFQEIDNYVSVSNLDVETACRNINLDEENINLVKLIYAKKFYSQRNFDKGDEFINSVEKSENKNQKVIDALVQIKSNKKFYSYREKQEEKFLSLSLKPHK